MWVLVQTCVGLLFFVTLLECYAHYLSAAPEERLWILASA